MNSLLTFTHLTIQQDGKALFDDFPSIFFIIKDSITVKKEGIVMGCRITSSWPVPRVCVHNNNYPICNQGFK